MRNKINRYFVDTNIIIDYERALNYKLNEFINNADNLFYYTETVKTELLGHVVPAIFNYMPTDLHQVRKLAACDMIAREHRLSDIQKRKFQNDICIVFESGYMCADVMASIKEAAPILITNNLKMYKKFLSENGAKSMEDCINKCGFEHLITVMNPREIIQDYDDGWGAQHV